MKIKLQQAILLSLATLSLGAQAQQAANLQAKIAMCIGCHGIPGYQASFPEIHKVPKISGQGERYIANALQAYAKGERKHPTMRGIAQSLSEQDIKDIAAYYAQQVKITAPETVPAPSQDVAKLFERGACASCHGTNFSKPLDPSYPKLGGQHADYLYVALKAYHTEGNPVVGRGNAIMGAQVKQFKPAELKQMAQYLASLDGELKTVPQSSTR
ncbi:c-type cytochrome [Roseateles sp. BYS180W]|uniref:C-type cytochrome n=1 Tax=Roseateles rivi TaxID=3299028 RepID=A0ABW7FS60_9BURK